MAARRIVRALAATGVFLSVAGHAWAHPGTADHWGGHADADSQYHCHSNKGTMRREACDLRMLVDIQQRKLIALEGQMKALRGAFETCAGFKPKE